MDHWVLVDTCIWASFFGKPGSPEKLGVDDLLDSDRVAIVGPVVAQRCQVEVYTTDPHFALFPDLKRYRVE